MEEEPKSTVDNSLGWRIWHGGNYLVGGVTFFLGSLLLFPIFSNYIDASWLSAWLYTIGSATFLLADITEWLHYVHKDCRYKKLVINFLVSVCGSLLYLIGSVCFIPDVNAAVTGLYLFIFGSTLIVISQSWKLYSSAIHGPGTLAQNIGQDICGFLVDVGAGLGGLMYFAGTFVFLRIDAHPDWASIAAFIYTLGGLFFLASALSMQPRYFCARRIQRASVFTEQEFNV